MFEKYLIRARLENKTSLKFDRFHSLQQSSPTVQIIAALIREDKEEVEQLLKQYPSSLWMTQMKLDLSRDWFCKFILEKIYKLDLQNNFVQAVNDKQNNLLDALKRSAIAESAEFVKVNTRLINLLNILHDYKNEICFEKGIVISRALYENPSYRVSSDIDVIVKLDKAKELIRTLIANGFKPAVDDPRLLPQNSSEIMDSVDHFFLTPHPEYVPVGTLNFARNDYPLIELKFDPLDCGLKMKEYERFWQDVVEISGQDVEFLAPDLVDHLMMELIHFHKHLFDGWQWLYDIHLLCLQLTPKQWEQLQERAIHEGKQNSVWAALTVAQDRLHTPIPQHILTKLQPKADLLSRIFTYTIGTIFSWNTNGFIMLLLSAYYGGDKDRKLFVLHKTLMPPNEFLSSYYASSQKLNSWQRTWYLCLHWVIMLVLPAIIRKIVLGPKYWTVDPNGGHA